MRSLAIARELSREFDVTLCAGGPVPPDLAIPDAVSLVRLPPIGPDGNGRLSSLDPALTLEQAWERRRLLLLELYAELRPIAIMVELFPFGRAKFATELEPLLQAARQEPRGVAVISSVRDLLVTAKPDQERHDNQAAVRLNSYFDAVIVHADDRFARLEETFRPTVEVNTPVYYSGFVSPGGRLPAAVRREPPEVLVSAGGGRDGGLLLTAALGAHLLALSARGFRTRLVTGPFIPPEQSDELQRAVVAARCETLSIERFIPDLAAELLVAAVSVSRGGYNTALDVIRSGVRSIVVPHDGPHENEQSERARRLHRLGVLTMLDAEHLNPERLAETVLNVAAAPAVRPPRLGLDGARNTAAIVTELVDGLQLRRRTTRTGRPPEQHEPASCPDSHVAGQLPDLTPKARK